MCGYHFPKHVCPEVLHFFFLRHPNALSLNVVNFSKAFLPDLRHTKPKGRLLILPTSSSDRWWHSPKSERERIERARSAHESIYIYIYIYI